MIRSKANGDLPRGDTSLLRCGGGGSAGSAGRLTVLDFFSVLSLDEAAILRAAECEEDLADRSSLNGSCESVANASFSLDRRSI